MGWKKRMEEARRGHRPSLKDWTQDNMAESFPPWRATLPTAPVVQMPPGAPHPPNLPAYLDGARLTYEDFAQQYEAHGIPCVIKNVPQAEGWSAPEKWQLETLMRDEELLDRKFKCGEDDDGKTIKVKLRHFLSYLRENRDDSPLYIFDSGFDDDKGAKRILDDYKVPSFFRDDLFGLVSESRRPPYRWWLVGPERSGTTVHIDPLNTSAWNTLIYGQKRWVVFPPNVPKSIVKGKGLIGKYEDDEAVHYFMNILPRIKARAAQFGNTGEYEGFACYEFTQNPGITQNFCSPRNFPQVWQKTRSGRKLMAAKWLNQLDIHYPQLAKYARYMNERDGYIMKYDPEKVRRSDEDKKRRREMKDYEERMKAEYARQQQEGVGGSKHYSIKQENYQDESPTASMTSSTSDRSPPEEQRSRLMVGR